MSAFSPSSFVSIIRNILSTKIEYFAGLEFPSFVKTIFSGFLDRGIHKFRWNATGSDGIEVGSGVYFYTIKSNSVSLSKKIVFAK